MSYRDSYHPRVKSDLKKIDISAAREIHAVHIERILVDPHSSDPLHGDLDGVWSYHFRKNNVDYRIAYFIEESEKTVYFLAVGKRETFYEILKRRTS